MDDLVAHLARHGFRRTDLVYEVGDFAVRGGILDLYPPGEESPVRLDFFGDTVESIRWFEPQSQRSEDTLPSVRLLPLYLFSGGAEDAADLAELVAAHEGPDLSPEGAELIESLRQRGSFPGWENYLPLLASATADLAEVLASPLILAVDPPALATEVDHHVERLAADFGARREHGKLAPPPEELEQPEDRVRDVLDGAAVRLRDLVFFQ